MEFFIYLCIRKSKQLKIMDNEKLSKGEIVIRVCPTTKRVVLAQYCGNDDVVCLHNDTIEEDVRKVLDYISNYIQ